MANLIESIFGKTSDIKKEEIQKKIVDEKEKESLYFDCKIIKEMDQESKEKILMSPLTAFLNSSEGKGLLCLGVKTKNNGPSKIVPINQNIIVNESQLRSLIIGNIKTWPKTDSLPKVTIEKIICDNENNVFLVEIERKDNNCAYYSGISDYFYIRQNDESKRLSFLETLSFVRNKIFPRVFIAFEIDSPNTNDEIVIAIHYVNEGLEPGKHVVSPIILSSDDAIEYKITGRHVLERTELRKEKSKTYQITLDQYSPPIVYPQVPFQVGHLKIKSKDDFKLKVDIKTYEAKGKSTQSVLISKNKENLTSKEQNKGFNLYIDQI